MRSDRTKEEFKQAFFKLVETKPISKITIQDLLNECGTARQTFYHHFLDKYDLISWIYTSEIQRIHNCYPNNIICFQCYCDIFKMMTEHKSFYMKAVSVEGQNSFYDSVYEHLINFFFEYIAEHFGAEELTEKTKFALYFYSSGAVAATHNWIKGGMQLPIEELAALELSCVPEELKRFFNTQ